MRGAVGAAAPLHLTGRSSAEPVSGTKVVVRSAGERCQAAASRQAVPSARVRVSRHARRRRPLPLSSSVAADRS